MARKTLRNGVIKGHGTTAWHLRRENGGTALVVLHGEVTDDADAGRPVQFVMTPADARKWAAGLIRMAEFAEGRDGASTQQPEAPEAEQVPARPTGRLAELLGLSEGESND
jgi:hypothetical protein